MLNCIIIDDEPLAIEILKDYIEKIPFMELLHSFRNPLKALEYLKENKIDLIFLDINMPDLTGMQFLNSLIHHPMVIFTTAYSEYAVESYEYDAVDYLLKPIEFVRFIKATNRALEQFMLIEKESLSNDGKKETNRLLKNDQFLIKSGTDLHKININDILYIQGAGNYCLFFTAKKKIMSLISLNELLKILPSSLFTRIHKSYIINLDHIDVIEKDQVNILDRLIPIGDKYKNYFFKIVNPK